MIPYHKGELSVQKKAGVQEMASRIGRSIRSTIPEIAKAFLSEQRFVIVGSVDAQGHAWASLLRGRPGFLSVPDERTLHISSSASIGDPLMCNISAQGSAGLVAIDFATRQRMRINGGAQQIEAGIVVQTEQVYSNCKKYMQARHLREPGDTIVVPDADLQRTFQTKPFSGLHATHRTDIAAADTFFIASSNLDGGVDVSHRGGMPGFVRVINDQTLLWPDYAGNTMFQTLGNLEENPSAGLLFINFETGRRLMLTGQAKVLWGHEAIKGFPGTERCIRFTLEGGIELQDAVPQHWRFESYSPFNPTDE